MHRISIPPIQNYECLLIVTDEISSHKAISFYSNFVFQMMTGLECGHLYCTSCWTEYLTTKIMDEGASQTIACPASQCDILVTILIKHFEYIIFRFSSYVLLAYFHVTPKLDFRLKVKLVVFESICTKYLMKF